MQDKIDIQRKKIEAGNPAIDISGSCRLDNGIIALKEEDKSELSNLFNERLTQLEVCFFTPASGSGSRMFSELFEYLDSSKDKSKIKLLIESISSMALFDSLSDDWKNKLKSSTVDEAEFCAYLVSEDGLNLSRLPKGLIPFHLYDGYSTNPIQEQLIQGNQIGASRSTFHFTIDSAFKEKIEQSIEEIGSVTAADIKVEFSVQDPLTDSVAFSEKLEPFIDANGNITSRPSGHGALIKNLNLIDADIAFIKNIDNIQHLSKAEPSLNTRQVLAGALLQFQDEVFNILSKIERGHAFESSVKTLNDKYDLRLNEELMKREQYVGEQLNRPIRICGMVKNEGEPGGGPYWVKSAQGESRQIIEKSQFSADPEQLNLMKDATHFNPVELVCGLRDAKGKKFNLLDFVNEEQYFIVHKTLEGQQIQYIEQPGLWNGAMANWITLFYEIDSICFSPVKTVFDLLGSLHRY